MKGLNAYLEMKRLFFPRYTQRSSCISLVQFYFNITDFDTCYQCCWQVLLLIQWWNAGDSVWDQRPTASAAPPEEVLWGYFQTGLPAQSGYPGKSVTHTVIVRWHDGWWTCIELHTLLAQAMFSGEGERVQLIQHISTSEAKGAVEKWLVQVEDLMIRSVRDVVARSRLVRSVCFIQ